MNFQKSRMSNFCKNNKIFALLISNSNNIFWYTRIESSAGYILYLNEECYLFIDSRYKTYVETSNNKQNIDKIIIIKNYGDDMLMHIKSLLTEKNIQELFLESSLDISTFFLIKNYLDKNHIKTNYINTNKLLISKEKAEVNNIKRGCDILANAIKHIKEWIQIGMTEKEVSVEIERYFFSHNDVQALAFQTIVAFGSNSALPHAKPTNNKLKKNDIVLIDCGVVINGYRSDQTRTFFINEPDKELAKIYELVLNSQKLAISKIKVGMKISELYCVARNYLDEKGYGKYFIHNLGHGLGVNIHEEPFLSPSNTDILESLSVITIEPGIYIEGLGGVRIEDDIYVNGDKIEILNSCPKDLEIIKK